MAFEIIFPYPIDFWSAIFAGIGMTFGGAFGKKLDEEIQCSKWWKKQNSITKSILKRLLDCLHHWWLGAIGMFILINSPIVGHPTITVCLFWFFFGVFLDDIRDWKHILERFKTGFNDLTGAPPVIPEPITTTTVTTVTAGAGEN